MLTLRLIHGCLGYAKSSIDHGVLVYKDRQICTEFSIEFSYVTLYKILCNDLKLELRLQLRQRLEKK